MILGWTGKWDDLPAAHLDARSCSTCSASRARRSSACASAGTRLAVTLAFAWAAYPFTQYVSSSNTNDAIMPRASSIWGFWLVTSPVGARRASSALAGWTKFAPLLVAPLWADLPERRWPTPAWSSPPASSPRRAAAFSVLLLEPSPLHAARVFWDRTLGWQLGRDSPFSIWDWRQYHARACPTSTSLQRVLEGLLVAGAVARRVRAAPQVAAAARRPHGGAAVGFELVLTHWFYLYLPWFFPFAAFAVLGAGRRAGEGSRVTRAR